LDYQNGKALVEVRNYFIRGEEVEIFSPNQDNRKIVIASISSEMDEDIEICNQPMSRVWIPIPFAVNAYDIMRKSS